MNDSSRQLFPLPTFIIIGAQKSATRWLRLNLGRHPEIFTAGEECQYFTNDMRFRIGGVGTYRQQFAGWRGEPFVGEATPGYMIWRHHPAVIAERIHQVVPDVRLLAILRNPVDRAQSALVHHARRGRVPEGARLVDIVRAHDPRWHRLGLIAGGWYAASLEPFREIFEHQLLVLLHDDLKVDPVGVYRSAVEHVGASVDFVPRELAEVRFSNQVPSKDVPRPSVHATTTPAPLTEEERRELYGYFRADVQALERMLGRDLSHWDPEVPRASNESSSALAG